MKLYNKPKTIGYRVFSGFLAVSFVASLIVAPMPAYAQAMLNLPAPGAMVASSPAFRPAIMAGITIDPKNPLQFNFIISGGDDRLEGETLFSESAKLINYFLASLTVPEDEMWVNLSPYEKNQIVAEGLGSTEMGRDMLAQDYLLKQFTASLMYPEEEVGLKFWQKVKEKTVARYGNVEIPTNTFNKVWIIPEKASVYVHDMNVFVAESYLKVMLEEDYVSLSHQPSAISKSDVEDMSVKAKEVLREIIIPEIEREVNTGKNFANLRQIYNSMILATWYKKNLRESILGKIYMDANKIEGINIDNAHVDQIYTQYVEAFKKGVYDFIKEDYDPAAQEISSKKYFSGGILPTPAMVHNAESAFAVVEANYSAAMNVVGVDLLPEDLDGTLITVLKKSVEISDPIKGGALEKEADRISDVRSDVDFIRRIGIENSRKNWPGITFSPKKSLLQKASAAMTSRPSDYPERKAELATNREWLRTSRAAVLQAKAIPVGASAPVEQIAAAVGNIENTMPDVVSRVQQLERLVEEHITVVEIKERLPEIAKQLDALQREALRDDRTIVELTVERARLEHRLLQLEGSAQSETEASAIPAKERAAIQQANVKAQQIFAEIQADGDTSAQQRGLAFDALQDLQELVADPDTRAADVIGFLLGQKINFPDDAPDIQDVISELESSAAMTSLLDQVEKITGEVGELNAQLGSYHLYTSSTIGKASFSDPEERKRITKLIEQRDQKQRRSERLMSRFVRSGDAAMADEPLMLPLDDTVMKSGEGGREQRLIETIDGERMVLQGQHAGLENEPILGVKRINVRETLKLLKGGDSTIDSAMAASILSKFSDEVFIRGLNLYFFKNSKVKVAHIQRNSLLTSNGISIGLIKRERSKLLVYGKPGVLLGQVSDRGIHVNFSGLNEVAPFLGQITESDGKAQFLNERFLQESKAAAMVPGGIDFNAAAMKLEEQGETFKFDIDSAMLEGLSPDAIQSLTPVIINITPIPNYLPLLGFNDETEEEILAMARSDQGFDDFDGLNEPQLSARLEE